MLDVADFERNVGSSREAGVGRRYAQLNRVSFWLLAALALAGAWSAAARAAPRWLWLLPVLLWLSTVVTIGTVRYRTPIDPFVVLLAATATRRP